MAELIGLVGNDRQWRKYAVAGKASTGLLLKDLLDGKAYAAGIGIYLKCRWRGTVEQNRADITV